MEQALMQGACRYLRVDGLARAGQAARDYGQRPLLLYGKRALEAAGEGFLASFAENGMSPALWLNDGFCSRSQVESAAQYGRAQQCDFLVAVGGGKSMDLGKATAAVLGIPVVTVPTVASTCAAVTPFSVMYDDRGRPDGAIYHALPVSLCLVDDGVLAAAPERYLRAGMVDSLAKLPELCSGIGRGEAATFRLDIARRLAAHVTEKLRPACRAAALGQPLPMEETIDAVLALTGTCSGYAAGTSQLALAHAFNGAVRYLCPERANGFLHGETVGVGILIQQLFNGEQDVRDMTELLIGLGMPASIAALGMTDEGVAGYIAAHMGFAPGSPEERRLGEAIAAVRL